MMSAVGICLKTLWLAARCEEIDWVHSEGVYEIVPMQECKDAGMKPLDLIVVCVDNPRNTIYGIDGDYVALVVSLVC